MAYWKSKSNATPIKQMGSFDSLMRPGEMFKDGFKKRAVDPNKEVDPNASINDRVNAVVEKKVDEVVNNKQGEGLI